MASIVEGLDDTIRRLNAAIARIEGKTVEGMREVGLVVQGEAMEITPQRTGVLINSAFSGVDQPTPTVIRTRVGYTASYAPYVHEMPETFNYTKPGTGPKFLEKTLKNSIPEILRILQESARVP